MRAMPSSTAQERSSTLARGVVATAAYTSRPPSPPYIFIPSLGTEGKDSLSIVPSFSNVDSNLLTKEDLEIITGGKTHIAVDKSCEWQYEGRRTAHPVLDFLYLGPVSMIRDESFLRTEGITMVLCVLDSRMSATFAAHQRRADALGIAADKVFIDSRMDLTRNFEPTVKMINDHLLSIYRGQAVQVGEGVNQGQMAISKTAEFKKGKVLVCCETGNERSPCVCAAYLMAIFGLSHVQAIQFVTLKRFSANFDDESKTALLSYDDILQARRDVMGMNLDGAGSELPRSRGYVSHAKRQIEDTMDISDDEASSEMDHERYVGREFVPFYDGTA